MSTIRGTIIASYPASFALGPLAIQFNGGSQAQVGAPYLATLTVSGGVLPYTLPPVVTSGALPLGLSFGSSGLTVEGIPAESGVYAFTLTVTDAASATEHVDFTINVSQPSGASVLVAPTSVVGRDVGHSTDVANPTSRLVSCSVGVLANFSGVHIEYLTIYVSQNNGTGSSYYWYGYPKLWTASGQEALIQFLRPTAAQTWKVAVVAGTIDGDPEVGLASGSLPTGAVISAGFAVAALALPSATLGTSPTMGSGVGGNWPYNATTEDGGQYFAIPDLSLDLSGAFADPNAFVVTNSYQDLDASHNPIGPEHVNGTVVPPATPVSGVVNFGPLLGNYGSDGSSYTRLSTYPTGTPANIAFVRWRVIVSNRVDQSITGWSNFTTTSTRQADVGGGAGYIDIPIALGGVPPPGNILGVQAMKDFHFSLFFDPGFGFCNPGVVVDPFNVLWGPGDFRSAAWLYECPSPGVISIETPGGHSGENFCRLTGASVKVGQLLTTTEGAQHLLSVWAQSSNSGSGSHLLQAEAMWADDSGATISTDTVTLIIGYTPTWTYLSSFFTAPTGAVWVSFYFKTGPSEPAGEYWDIDELYVQGTIKQTANNQTVTTAPFAGAIDYSALRVNSLIDLSNSYYGRQYMSLTGPGGGGASLQVGAAGFAAFSLNDDGSTQSIGIALGNASAPTILARTGGVNYSSFSGSLAAAISGGKQVIAGVIMN